MLFCFVMMLTNVQTAWAECSSHQWQIMPEFTGWDPSGDYCSSASEIMFMARFKCSNCKFVEEGRVEWTMKDVIGNSVSCCVYLYDPDGLLVYTYYKDYTIQNNCTHENRIFDGYEWFPSEDCIRDNYVDRIGCTAWFRCENCGQRDPTFPNVSKDITYSTCDAEGSVTATIGTVYYPLPNDNIYLYSGPSKTYRIAKHSGYETKWIGSKAYYKCGNCNKLLSDYYGTTEATIALNQDANNSTALSTINGCTTNVTLNRTMNVGGWNTFCAPFNISSSQITSVFGSGTKVRELGGSDFNSTTKALTLNFTEATNIDAGKPYLVYLGSSSNVVNPTFNSVTIADGTTTKTTTYADFVPVMNPTNLTGGDKTILFVTGGTDGNRLTYPNATGNINGFRAYFKLKGDAASAARSFTMSFDDGEATMITTTDCTDYTDDGAWYTLEGRKLDKKPSSKGVYIVNGKKTVIK